jgi:hypothetical protein
MPSSRRIPRPLIRGTVMATTSAGACVAGRSWADRQARRCCRAKEGLCGKEARLERCGAQTGGRGPASACVR